MKDKKSPVQQIKKPVIKTCTDKQGKQFYISGIQNDSGIWTATIRYIETGEFKIKSYKDIVGYL